MKMAVAVTHEVYPISETTWVRPYQTPFTFWCGYRWRLAVYKQGADLYVGVSRSPSGFTPDLLYVVFTVRLLDKEENKRYCKRRIVRISCGLKEKEWGWCGHYKYRNCMTRYSGYARNNAVQLQLSMIKADGTYWKREASEMVEEWVDFVNSDNIENPEEIAEAASFQKMSKTEESGENLKRDIITIEQDIEKVKSAADEVTRVIEEMKSEVASVTKEFDKMRDDEIKREAERILQELTA